jgi:hypothetical protein
LNWYVLGGRWRKILIVLYGHTYYGEIEGMSEDEFVKHVLKKLYGVCMWLGSFKRDGGFSEEKLLVGMDGDYSKTE